MRIISGKNILNRAMPERLRTLRHCIFTGEVVERNGICSAASYGSAALAAGVLAPRGAVAQRLRGFKSAEPKKTVKRSSRRTGVNLQFFSVQPTSSGLKGASSPFFVAPARRNRWWFSGSLLPPKENIPPAASRMVTASSTRPDSGYSRADSAPETSRPPGSAWLAARRAAVSGRRQIRGCRCAAPRCI